MFISNNNWCAGKNGEEYSDDNYLKLRTLVLIRSVRQTENEDETRQMWIASFILIKSLKITNINITELYHNLKLRFITKNLSTLTRENVGFSLWVLLSGNAALNNE